MTVGSILQRELERATISVLYVEDSPEDARLVELLLEQSGAKSPHLVVAQDLAGGVRALRDERFDVVLLDLSLPDARGTEIVRKIRATAPDLAIVVLTGDTRPGQGEASVAAGAQDFVCKADLTADLLARALRYALLRTSNDKLRRDRLRERVRRDQVDSVERLASNIAHELNNSLTVLRSASDLLLMPDLTEAERESFSSSLEDGMARASAIADQLFALAGGRPARTRESDLEEVLRALAPPLGRVLGDRAKLVLRETVPSRIAASRGAVELAIKKIVYELVDRVESASLARTGLGRAEQSRAVPQIELSVRSRGDGWTIVFESDAPFVAELFERLLDDVTVRASARAAGARLKASQCAEGRACLTLVFGTSRTAAAGRQAAKGAEERATASKSTQTGYVLVIDDEPAVRVAVTRLVASFGYEVVDASSEVEAVERVRARGGLPTMAVVDIRLPETTGIEIMSRLRGDTEIPVVFISGFNEEFDEVQSYGAPWELLDKPFSRDDLGAALARLMPANARGA